MAISKLLRTAAIKAGNYIGLYTKQQSVESAINIGKELVDLSKGGTSLTQDVIQSAIHKYVPKAKVKIFTDRKELDKILKEAGENAEALGDATKGSAAQYLNLLGKVKGIYIPKIETPHDAAKFAHEFEHYMYNEHTPKRKLCLTSVQKILGLFEKKNPPEKETYTQIQNESNIQKSLWKLFGMEGLQFKADAFDGVKSTAKSISDFLGGKNFTGLTSEKRINAYIRTICRNHMHPGNPNNAGKIYLTKTTLDDEVRAYEVTDKVLRYGSGSEDVTLYGYVADIYRRTGKVLKGEFKTALCSALKSKNGTQVIKTGLPSSSYRGPKNFLDIFCTDAFESGKAKIIDFGMFAKLNACNAV